MTARGIPAVGLALLAAGAASAPASAATQHASAAAVPASQQLVTLRRDHVARTRPSTHARRLKTVRARRPLTRVRTVLPVLDEATTGGLRWLRVRLPGRPNGNSGWIPAAHTEPGSTTWRLAVDISSRRVTVYHDGRVARRFRAVVGRPGTPTPSGQFFVEEVVKIASHDTGGPYALATSALSNVFQEFEGGPGQVAIHGTRNLGGALGSAVSHGCVRISPAAITWLAKRIDSGAPLTITR